MSDDFAQDPALVQEFLIESEELLEGIDQDMVKLEATPNEAEVLNRIFRALHTIKGTSGFLGFEPVVRLSHRAEDVLNDLRKGEIQLTKRMMNALLAARDQLGGMLADIRQGGLTEYAIDDLVSELEIVRRPGETLERAGEMPAAEAAIEAEPSEVALPEPAESPKELKTGELAIEKPPAPSSKTDTHLRKKQAGESAGDASAQTMRVDVRKLDELINLIGELVLERNRLVQLSRDLNAKRVSMDELDSSFSQSTSRLSFITEELQTAGLKTRMVPIDTVFRKFPRLVRDVADSLNKEVELLVRGQETELDKTIVESIGDPLVHLVRNSLDHGLELPDVRVAAGKARKGTIRLEARQEGDQIIISVSDDGGGIDPERVARKAVEKGLVTAERVRAMSPREIYDFIFLPGFSTVEKATDLSGRGVGMDVVRSNLRKLNGTIGLDSRVGQGTTVALRLPLTLAIFPVLLVQTSEEVYAVPLRSVLETAHIQGHELHRLDGGEWLYLRGETLPLLRLREMFALKTTTGKGGDKVVILGVGEKRVALLVDHLLGQESTVVKPMGSYLHHCPGIAGATIGSDGHVRLVLDPTALLASASGAAVNELMR